MLAIALSGCTGSNDVTSAFKALPEVQQFLSEHPTAKISMTYWSKEDVEKSANEISQQCDKTITPEAMYKATVSEGDLKIISWINADTQIIMCSVTQGNGNVVKQPTTTTTTTQSPMRTPYIQPPQASIRATKMGAGFVIIEHQGGEDLILNGVKIIVEQGTSRAIFDPVSLNNDKFVAGDNLIMTQKGITLNEKLISSGKITIDQTENGFGEITITMIDLIGGQQIASMRYRGAESFFIDMYGLPPKPMAPQASLRATGAGSGFVKVEHQGGADIVLSDTKIMVEQGGSKATYATAGQSVDKFLAGDTLTITPTGISLNGRNLTTGKISIEPMDGTNGEITITLFDIVSGMDIGQMKIRTVDIFFK